MTAFKREKEPRMRRLNLTERERCVSKIFEPGICVPGPGGA
jgi:hypothetical protein